MRDRPLVLGVEVALERDLDDVEQRDDRALVTGEQQGSHLERRVVDRLLTGDGYEDPAVIEAGRALLGAPEEVHAHGYPTALARGMPIPGGRIGQRPKLSRSARRARKAGVVHEALDAVDVVADSPKLDRVVGRLVADLEDGIRGIRQTVARLAHAAGVEQRPATDLDGPAGKARLRADAAVERPVHGRHVGVAEEAQPRLEQGEVGGGDAGAGDVLPDRIAR
jgi:hypothetical protein